MTLTQVAFSRENVRAFYEDAWKLVDRHRLEVDGESAGAIDMEGYDRAEQSGRLRVFTVRAAPSLDLVGYAVFFIAADPHDVRIVKATADLVYLEPAARRGWTASRFLRFCESELAFDADSIFYSVPKKSRALARVLERNRYAPVENVYARRVH